MAPRDPAGIGPAETLSLLYRIEATADDMSKRPNLDPDHPVSTEERAAWATIKSLCNLMHAEFSAILNRSYDPHRHLALLVEVIRLHDYRHLCGLVGMNVPPVVELSHAAQQRGKFLSEQKWSTPGSESWLEVLESSPAAPQQLARVSQHLAEGSQGLPPLSQLLPVVPRRLPRAPSFYSTNPASYITAPIPSNATQIPHTLPTPPPKSRKRKSRSEQKASSSRQPASSFEKQPPSEQATAHKSQVEGRDTEGEAQDEPPEQPGSPTNVSPADAEESQSSAAKRQKGLETSHD